MEVEFSNLKEDDDFLPRLGEIGGDARQNKKKKKKREELLKLKGLSKFPLLEDNE